MRTSRRVNLDIDAARSANDLVAVARALFIGNVSGLWLATMELSWAGMQGEGRGTKGKMALQCTQVWIGMEG
jgi:hypothetical protein